MATNKDFIVKNGLVVQQDVIVTGRITQSGLEFPASDGTDGQFLKTDGAGSLSFATIPETGFQTIAVTGQTSITSDQVNDTLTFAAGTGIAITTDEPTDVVTIAVDANTDEITEGSTNLFHTDQRAVDAVEAHPHLTIDGGTLYVDTDNNYVGIGDTSPQHVLDVAGAIGVNGTEVINSSGEVVSSVDDSALTVGGSLSGPLSNTKVQYGTTYSGTPAQGSFFFDSLNQKLMVYTGSSFVDAVPAGSGGGGDGEITDANTTFRKYSYTITSTTNAISGADDSSETLSYVTDGTENVEVYVNGIKQVEGSNRDYVATTGNSVTFTYNVPTGSTVDIQVYEFLSNDAYYVKSEVYTKTETNTQISTAISGPIAPSSATINDVEISRITGANDYTQIKKTSTGSNLAITSQESIYFNIDANNDQTNRAVFIATNTDAPGSGTVIAKFQEDGKVGIGTESPSAKLNVVGSAGDPGISIKSGGNGGVDPFKVTWTGGTEGDMFIVDDNGNVGIGATDPQKKLEVAGDIQLDATDANIWIKSGAAGTNGFVNWTFNTDDTVYNKIGMDYDTRASTGFHIDAGYPITIDATASGGKAINFAIGGTTKAVLDGNGNVGIGTTSPDHKLHVNGTGSDGSELLHISSNGDVPDGGYHWLTTEIAGSQSTNANIVHMIGKELAIKNAGYFGFHYAGDHSNDNFITLGGYAADQLLNIKMNGNVGIGTTDPGSKLHVDGTIRAGVAGNSSANLSALKVFSSGTSSTQSAIAIQQGTIEGDTIIFADYDPHVNFGISAVNDIDAIDFTGGSSTGSIGTSKLFYNNAGEAKDAHVKLRVHLNSGLLEVGGDITTSGVFRGKIPFMVVVHNDGARSYPDGNSNVYYNLIRHNAGGVGHNSNYNFTFTHPGYYRMTTTYRYGAGGDVWTTMDLVDGGTILGTGHGTGQISNDPATNVFDYVVRIDTGNVGRNLQQRVRRSGSGFTIANTNYGDELITIVQWMGSL